MDIVVLGLVIGMANALLATGLVLIHKANRVINLAHGELGAFTVAMMLSLTRVAHLNYWLALLASLAGTAALAAMIERSVLRRLFRSPRLIMLIATIGVAQLVIVLRLVLPKPRTAGGQSILFGGGLQFPVPFHMKPVVFGRIVLGPAHFMALVAGPLLALGLFLFLRRSSYGIALRAAAENAPRAQLLGIPVRRVSTLAWVLAGLLSGVASVLLAPIIGFTATEAVGLPLLMRGLAAATVARMESVAVAFWVGLGLGVTDQVLFFWLHRSDLTDVVLFIVILAALVPRRARQARTVAAEESSWEMSDPVRPLPIEIASNRGWRALSRGALVGGLAVVAAGPFLLGASATFFVSTVFLVAAVAVSITVLTGWAGQMSIGQWALAGAGGVFGSKLVGSWGWPFWPSLVVAGALGMVLAVAIGLPALRLEGTELAVVTLGFAVVSASWLFDQDWFAGDGFMPKPEYLTTRWYYVAGLAFLAITVAATRALQRSRIGRNTIAVRDNPRQAASLGVGIVATKLTAFAISGAIAAAAGFLWAAGIGLADPSVFPPVRSLSIVAAVVIGGLGSVPGAVLGAFYMLGIPYFGARISPYIGLLSTGFGLLVLLIFLPGGLARMAQAGRDLLARAVTGIDPRRRVDSAPDAPEAAPDAPAAPEEVRA
ncbi:MAG: ABC transporter permease [Acidobacteria bacterium]|nr:ABC transporter permease [Acidobacteriota bacterium]